jgi:hypothetical protein
MLCFVAVPFNLLSEKFLLKIPNNIFFGIARLEKFCENVNFTGDLMGVLCWRFYP